MLLLPQGLKAQDLTISSSGETGTSGTNWSITGTTLTATGTANIQASVIETALSSGNLTVVAGDIQVSQNITSNTANVLTLKASGYISLEPTQSITRSGGDVILWSNSANETSGVYNNEIWLRADNTINTNGGKIVLAGGPDDGSNGGVAGDGIPDGFAYRGYNDYGAVGFVAGGGNPNTGNITLNSGGGDILIRGQGYLTGVESRADNLVINSGAGTVRIEGIAQDPSTGTVNSQGIAFRVGNSTITSANTTANAITLIGTSTSPSDYADGILLWGTGTQEFSATGSGGGVTITSTAGANKLHTFLINDPVYILANGGPINITATGGISTAKLEIGTETGSKLVLGATDAANTTNDVTSSTSNITVDVADRGYFWSANVNPAVDDPMQINTTGTVTFSHSAFDFNNSWVTFGATPSGLTIGIATGNTGNVTFDDAQTVNGPISVYGNGINVNANLESTASGAAILLQSNGAGSTNNNGYINLASSRNITTNGGDIILWTNAANRTSGTANNELILESNNTLTSNGGKIVLAGGLDDGGTSSGIPGLTAGDGIPDGYVYRGSNAGAAVDIRGGVTLNSGGGEIIIRGEQNGSDSGIELDATFTISNAGEVTIEGKNSASVATAKSVYIGTANITATAANAGVTILGNTHIQNTGLTTVSTQGGDVLIAGNIDDANDGETATNGQIRLTSGVSITTNGGNITLAGGDRTGTGYAQGATSNNIQEGVRIDGTANLQSGGGNIIIRGKSPLVQAGSGAGASGVGFYFLTSSGEINSGTGTILIDGYSQTSGSIASAGLLFWNNSANTFTIQSANTTASAITINAFSGANGVGGGETFGLEVEAPNTLNVFATGVGGGITFNTGYTWTGQPYDIVFRGPTNILANGGPIALKGGQNGGGANGYLFTGNELFLGSKASTSVATSSSDVTIQFDRFTFTGGVNPKFATTGSVTVQPNASSFGDNITTAWFNFNQNSQTMGGLTIGKDGSTAGITQATVNLTANGPVSFYGGDLAINENIITTDGGAAGDVLMKGLSDITMAVSKSIVTGGADITLWSDADDDGGHIYLPNGVVLDSRTAADRTANNTSTASGGGSITLGGGSTSTTLASGTVVPTGVAWQTDGGIPSGVLMGTYFSGITNQNTGIQLLSGGGDITLRGKSSVGTDLVRTGVGIMEGTTIDAGTTGGVTIAGEAVGPSANGVAGVDFPAWRTGLSAPVLRTHDGNISITGSSTDGVAVLLGGHSSAPPIIASTGTGSLTVEGTGTGANSNVSISATRLLASSGLIRVKSQDGTVSGSQTGVATPIALGSLAGTPVTSSTSNVEIISNALSLTASNGFAVNTSGTFTLEPAGDDFTSAITYPIADLSLDAAVSGLTIGKASSADGTSDVNVTVASATSIAGPISIYGGDVTINENLNTTGGGANGDILLKGSGNIVQTDSKSMTTSGGDVTLWSNSDDETTNGGYIYLQDNTTIDTRTDADRTANDGSANDISGGAITLGGGAGTTVPTGYALNNANSLRGGISIGTESGGQRHNSNITLISGGGNLFLKGKQTSILNGDAAGISAYEGFILDAGKTGNITLEGDVSSAGPSYSDGINLGNFATTAGGTASYIKTVDGNITFIGSASDAITQSRGLTLAGGGVGLFIQSSGTGSISLSGTPGGTGLQYNILLVGANILASSGGIDLVGGSTGKIFNAFFGSTIGYKTGTDILSSTSNITVTGDDFDLSSGFNFNTAGSLTLESFGNSFTNAFSTSQLTYSSDLTSLTIGKSTNTANVTVGSATTIAGPVTLYGGNLAINAALTSTGNNINLHASGAVTQTAAITANGVGMHGAGTFTLTHADNQIGVLAGGSSSSRLGAVTVQSKTALTIGSVNPDGIYSSDDILVYTTNGGNINLNQPVNTTSTGANAIRIYADLDAAAGTSTGGQILVNGGSVTTGTGGFAKLYSGNEGSSIGLNALTTSTAFRLYNKASTLANDNGALGISTAGTYAIYRDTEYKLDNLTVTVGTLTPVFASSTSAYTITESSAPGTFGFTPTAAQGTIYISREGAAFTAHTSATVYTDNSPDPVSTKYTIQVRDAGGTVVKSTYTLHLLIDQAGGIPSAGVTRESAWQSIFEGSNFDPNDDQQATAETDLVGDASNAMLMSQQRTLSIGGTVEKVYYFRVRLGNTNKPNTSGYFGLDIDQDLNLDMVVQANLKDKNPYVGFHVLDPSKDGSGPSQTAWLNSQNNTNIERRLATSSSSIAYYPVSTTASALGSEGVAALDMDAPVGGQNNGTDTWLEFAFTESSFVSFGLDALGETLTGSSVNGMVYFTSTSQTANGDIGGINDGTADLSKSWAELGVIYESSLEAATSDEKDPPVAVVVSTTSLNGSGTIYGTWNGPQICATSELSVLLNGVTYSYTLPSTSAGINLTTPGGWNVPFSGLAAGTYPVTVTITDPCSGQTGQATAEVLISSVLVTPLLTTSTQPTLTGTSNTSLATITVEVFNAGENSQFTETVTSDANGNWSLDVSSITPTAPTLALGTYRVNASVTIGGSAANANGTLRVVEAPASYGNIIIATTGGVAEGNDAWQYNGTTKTIYPDAPSVTINIADINGKFSNNELVIEAANITISDAYTKADGTLQLRVMGSDGTPGKVAINENVTVKELYIHGYAEVASGKYVSVAGDFSNGDSLILNYGANGYSQLHFTGNYIGGATVRIEQQITGTGWHNLSNPFENQTASSFGVVGTDRHTNAENLRQWNPEAAYVWENISSGTSALDPGRGYIGYFGTNPDGFASGLQLGTGPWTLSITGKPMTTVSPILHHYVKIVQNTWEGFVNDNETDGWNLVGNPFTSILDFSTLTRPANVNNAFYIWDPNKSGGAGYVSWSGAGITDPYIAPLQAFWVQTAPAFDNGGGAARALNMSMATHGTVVSSGNRPGFFKTAGADFDRVVLRVKPSAVQEWADHTVIALVEGTDNGYDADWDAYKWLSPGTTPNLYSVYGQSRLANNAVSYSWTSAGYKSIPVGFSSTEAGAFSIGLDEDWLLRSYYLTLEDRVTGKLHDLVNAGAYGFTHDPSITNRFILHIGNNPITLSAPSAALDAGYWADAIHISSLRYDGMLSCTLVDITGREILHRDNLEIVSGGTIEIQLTQRPAPGTYVLHVVAGEQTYAVKVTL